MKSIIKIAYICTVAAFFGLFAGGCSYNELPPKTEDATDSYVLPVGEVPTAQERALMQEARDEYNRFLESSQN